MPSAKQIFYQEFSQQESLIQVDTDKYDRHADLLIIKDLKTNAVVGTYRIINSDKSTEFYSASEFHIESFTKNPEKKIELSRACIHPKYRNGRVITLLWKGLFDYLTKSKARYLFGCSSVTNSNPAELSKLITFLYETKAIRPDCDILPKKEFDQSATILKMCFENRETSFNHRQLPPLLRSYLKVGAKISPIPAYDHFFSCYDFFTVLDTKALRENYIKKLGTQ